MLAKDVKVGRRIRIIHDPHVNIGHSEKLTVGDSGFVSQPVSNFGHFKAVFDLYPGVERTIYPEEVELIADTEDWSQDLGEFGFSVQEVVNEVRDTLIAKNKAYGNSALEPVRVFSTADPVEQLRVRIDDKLSRLKSSLNDDNEDTVLDLMGYLVLLRIATRKQDSE